MASAPSTPKAGWEIKTLGEVCEVIAGQSPQGKYYNDRGDGLPFYQGKKEFGEKFIGEATKWTSKTTREANDGDILMSVRAPVGPINFATERICIGRGLASIRASEIINRDFLFYSLLSIQKMIQGNEGAVFASINKKQIENLPTAVPPLAEQERIVGILDEAFEGIAAAAAQAEKNLHNARELFQSVLQSTFSQKGHDWVETTLGELGKVSMCKRILKHQTASEGDIPFYKIGTFGKTPNAFISKEIYDEFREKYSFPKKGNILISASGTIGRRVIYDGEPAYFQDSNIVWIANNENLILNSFLYYFYDICEWNPSRGATISRLYNDDLRKIKISFPANREKQLELVDVFKNLEIFCKKLEAIYERKKTALSELKQSLLQKAFAGEL